MSPEHPLSGFEQLFPVLASETALHLFFLSFFLSFGLGCFSVNKVALLSQIIVMPEGPRLTVSGVYLAFQSFCSSRIEGKV